MRSENEKILKEFRKRELRRIFNEFLRMLINLSFDNTFLIFFIDLVSPARTMVVILLRSG